MKVNIDDLGGTVVKNNETYTVIDNTHLRDLVVSKTILHPMKKTTGHKHAGQEEVYYFIHGRGKMQLEYNTFSVWAGDVVLIPDGAFHRVINESSVEDLTFLCVFSGTRSH